MKAAKIGVLAALLLIPTINLHAWPIPDTGQIKCYNNTAEIPCPAPGEPFYGQDGNYTINPPSYMKLGASGEVLPDNATSWAMVRDNVTGLIWENKTNDGSIHDGSKTFTWCDTNPATNGGVQGTCGTGAGDAATDSEAFIKALNNTWFGGFSDWRTPTVKELTMIVDRNHINPSVNDIWFLNTASSNYWASTLYCGYPGAERTVSFSGGSIGYSVKYSSESWVPAPNYAVRAVRGTQAENRFINNGDGTILDTATGLMWQQETQIPMDWPTTLSTCENLLLAGYDDWRIPNINELQSIIKYPLSNPAIDANVFPGLANVHALMKQWSSTTYTSSPDTRWFASFECGEISASGAMSNTNAVRAVRGGQSRSIGNLVIVEPVQAGRLSIGALQMIVWDTAGISGNVKITLSRHGGKSGTFTEIISDSTPNTGSYNWTVTGPESYKCALRIEPVSDPSKGTTQSLFTIISMQKIWITSEKWGDLGHYRLILNAQYIDGILPLETVWTSSDPTVAFVSNNYLVALRNGYVDISTTHQGQTYKKGLFVYTNLEAGESEGNNTKDVADTMTVSADDSTQGKFYLGTLTAGDEDWFKFTLAQSSIVNVGYLSQSTIADIKVDLYNASNSLLASGTSTNGAPLILPVGLGAGNYYLKLNIAGDVDQTGNYIVTYKILGNLPTKTTTPIAFGESKTGTIDTLADLQEMTFTLATEQAINLLFTPSSPTAKYRLSLLAGKSP